MKCLHGMAKAIGELRKIEPEIEAQAMLTLLWVAIQPGITMKELSERIGVSQSTTSRNVAMLGEINRRHEPGHGLLVAREDPTERRRKIVELTAKGRLVVASIAEHLAQ
jgi:DNA-binding MarR family transcriptional regulator